jgi:hypothetical protein
MTAHIRVDRPSDATEVDDWFNSPGDTMLHDDTGVAMRTFTGSSWEIPAMTDPDGYVTVGGWSAPIRVEIRGLQWADGRISRWVSTTGLPVAGVDHSELTPTVARMLAESLQSATREIERMA